MAKLYDDITKTIGNTPMVKLNHIVDDTMATVLVKMEQLNPSGSVKDRMAIHMVLRAEEQGVLKPGYTIVESTSGNTGLGLAIVASIAAEHRAYLRYHENEPRGTRFLMEFPVEAVAEPQVPGGEVGV